MPARASNRTSVERIRDKEGLPCVERGTIVIVRHARWRERDGQPPDEWSSDPSPPSWGRSPPPLPLWDASTVGVAPGVATATGSSASPELGPECDSSTTGV